MPDSCCKECALDMPCAGDCGDTEQDPGKVVPFYYYLDTVDGIGSAQEKAPVLMPIPAGACCDLGTLVAPGIPAAAVPAALGALQTSGMLGSSLNTLGTAMQSWAKGQMMVWPLSQDPAWLIRAIAAGAWAYDKPAKVSPEGSWQAKALLDWINNETTGKESPNPLALAMRQAIQSAAGVYPALKMVPWGALSPKDVPDPGGGGVKSGKGPAQPGSKPPKYQGGYSNPFGGLLGYLWGMTGVDGGESPTGGFGGGRGQRGWSGGRGGEKPEKTDQVTPGSGNLGNGYPENNYPEKVIEDGKDTVKNALSGQVFVSGKLPIEEVYRAF